MTKNEEFMQESINGLMKTNLYAMFGDSFEGYDAREVQENWVDFFVPILFDELKSMGVDFGE